MENKFTSKEYAQKAVEANQLGKKLYVLNGDLVIEEFSYYVCQEGSNLTDGTLNPDFEAEKTAMEKQRRIEEIHSELDELDKKRVRAICEPQTYSLNDETVNWLEHYNFQVFTLRDELATLQA